MFVKVDSEAESVYTPVAMTGGTHLNSELWPNNFVLLVYLNYRDIIGILGNCGINRTLSGGLIN